MYNWQSIGLDSILSGKDAQGVAYLSHFLKDYVAMSNEVVNASCPKCINQYYNRYIKLTTMSDNKSQYKLHVKREGLPLAFGSNIKVTNNNITDAYAKKLIERYKKVKPDFSLDYLFSEYPKETEPKKETVAKAKKPRTKRKSNE